MPTESMDHVSLAAVEERVKCEIGAAFLKLKGDGRSDFKNFTSDEARAKNIKEFVPVQVTPDRVVKRPAGIEARIGTLTKLKLDQVLQQLNSDLAPISGLFERSLADLEGRARLLSAQT